MLFKNQTTGEEMRVSNLCMKDGRVFFSVRNSGCGDRFLRRNVCLRLIEHADNGSYLECAEGWEIVKSDRKPRQPRTPKTPEQPQPEVVVEAEVVNEEEVTPQPTPATDNATDSDAVQLAAILARMKGGNVDEKRVRDIVLGVLREYATQDEAKVQKIVKRATSGTDVHCPDFDELCAYVAQGQPVYMYGAAGCGKSHTAEQIAEALGLPYYTQSQILFAHDVKGYGDANGKYQGTPFYEAFTQGGVFFIDEMDASAAEALVVLNTAIANRRYDFPIIGNVQAHPNFRIIAAGNTAMTGADMEYTARFVQDASTRNRFAFFKMQYDRNVELPVMAGGDEVLYNFICDLRQAIDRSGIQLCVSYRQTAILASELTTKFGRDRALLRNVFGGREQDEIRTIYGQLTDKENVWARAMRKLL